MRPLPVISLLKQILFATAILSVGACYPALPGAGGAKPDAATPASRWTPPESSARDSRLLPDSLPASLQSRRTNLTTGDLVSLALERSPETRATWLAAQSASALYGDARAALFPTLNASVNVNRLKTAATSGRVSVEQTTYGPSISLSWLLFDFGGRSASIEAARDGYFAANWTHNEMISDVVRRTIQGYFAYVGARGLLDAERTSLQESEVNLAASDDRRAVGVATIAEVLQARTAVAQARLAMQQAEGALASTRGALATLIGLPPNAAFDVDTVDANAPVSQIAVTVDSLMALGLLDRADLAAERAQVDVRQAQARATKSQRLPSLSGTGNSNTLWVGSNPQSFPSYNVGLALTIPLFNGFGWEFATRAAQLTADAEAQRLRTMERQVALEVFQTYQQLRTATQSVSTSDELFTNASASADAARARYREGVGSLLELLTAENALAGARAQRIVSRVQWHTSLVQLAHDAGLLQANGATQVKLAPTTGGN